MARFSGSTAWTIFEPSSGGMGIKFRKASARFMVMRLARKRTVRPIRVVFPEERAPIKPSFWKKNLYTKIARAAMAKLVAGPASATRAMSFRGSLKWRGFMGTGLA